jgi:hypothetical protein
MPNLDTSTAANLILLLHGWKVPLSINPEQARRDRPWKVEGLIFEPTLVNFHLLRSEERP